MSYFQIHKYARVPPFCSCGRTTWTRRRRRRDTFLSLCRGYLDLPRAYIHNAIMSIFRQVSRTRLLELMIGIEPITGCLQNSCSAYIELHQHRIYRSRAMRNIAKTKTFVNHISKNMKKSLVSSLTLDFTGFPVISHVSQKAPTGSWLDELCGYFDYL